MASSDSDLDQALGIRNSESIRKFVETLGKYRIETDLDRQLLIGVLLRDCHHKSSAMKRQKLATEVTNHQLRP